MRILTLGVMLSAALIAGCSSGLPPEPPPPQPLRLARPAYWYSQPANAAVSASDYDRLWDACGQVARRDLFTLDLQDYREGILTTQPLISKQIFEFWRPDTGNAEGALQNSLQTIRRTIRFEFYKADDGYHVTPKVLIERYSQPDNRLTSPAQYRTAFAYKVPGADETGIGGAQIAEHWYAIGRDADMEKQLAQAIQDRLK